MAAGPRRRRRTEPRRTERDVRRRAHGQKFLRRPSLVETLVQEAGVGPSDLVVEPGAGTGAITERLAAHAGRVVAIEVDPHWCARLEERFGRIPNVELRCEDFFEHPLPREPYRVFANIPFAVTT